MDPSQNPLEPESRKGLAQSPEPQRERNIARPPESEAQESMGFRRGQEAMTTDLPVVKEPPTVLDPIQKKRQSWLLPIMIAGCLLGAVGIGLMHTPPPVLAAPHDHQILTISGADLDLATTDRAVADIKGGVNDPLVAHLSEQVKQELLSGHRKFYQVPMEHPSAQAPAPASAPQPDSVDRIRVDFNGVTYGEYTLTKDPVSLDMPLEMGDRIAVTCLSVATGKTSLIVDLATVLNPVQSDEMIPGDVENVVVQQSSTGQNYDWFEQEAAQGNPVAQYGLGHMYQYGLGVQQDQAQAIHWYQLAAAQNYLDAKTQLSILSSP